jgi:hypothetical protein
MGDKPPIYCWRSSHLFNRRNQRRRIYWDAVEYKVQLCMSAGAENHPRKHRNMPEHVSQIKGLLLSL